ncbi:MAG: hypothetical protein WCF90_01565 [Methanomicrobiales archaeon]
MKDYFDKADVIWDKDSGRIQMAKKRADTMINVLHPDGTGDGLRYRHW